MKVPSKALQMTVGQFELAEGGKDRGQKVAKLTLAARSFEPVDHWFFGPTYHDFEGMQMASKIPVDYQHNPNEIMGFCDRSEIDDKKGLMLMGTLIPWQDDDRAAEVIHKQSNGVPYEASIDYVPSHPGDLQMQRLGEDEIAEVNGKTVNGPAMIVRRWKLRGVAITPHGMDGNTEAFLQSSGQPDEVEVEEIVKDKTLTPEQIAANEQQAADKVIADKAADKIAADKDAVKAQLTAFRDEFGVEKAVEYIAEGLSLEDARGKFIQSLQADNKAKDKKIAQLSASTNTAAAPVDGQDPADDGDNAVKGLKSDEYYQQRARELGLEAAAGSDAWKEFKAEDEKRLRSAK